MSRALCSMEWKGPIQKELLSLDFSAWFQLAVFLLLKGKKPPADCGLLLTLSGGIADCVAKWVFKQDLSPPLLRLGQQRKKTENDEEPAQIGNYILAEDTENQAGLETILGKDAKHIACKATFGLAE